MDDNRIYAIARKLTTSSHNVRVGGKIEFVKDQGPVRRDIRAQDFDWSSDALRNLAKILWATQRAHSYAIAALRLLSKMPSSQFSPDGLLGGRGYIQSVKDMRNGLSQSVEVLSSFTDTIYDEINASHWQGIEQEEPEVGELVQDAQDVKANPEAFVEQQYEGDGEFLDSSAPSEEQDEDEPIANPDPDDYNPEFDSGEEEDEPQYAEIQSQLAAKVSNIPARHPDILGGSDGKDVKPKTKPASQLPTDISSQMQAKSEGEIFQNTTTPDSGNYASAIRRTLDSHQSLIRQASSSLPVETLPGPRVDHIGPGMSDDGFWGDGNSSDDPTGYGLSSGTNETHPLYEDWVMDGVTGYDNPTDGDESTLKISSRIARETYSWLPGANNDKNLDYYRRGLSDEDVEWMRQHAAPNPPIGFGPKTEKIDTSYLWEINF